LAAGRAVCDRKNGRRRGDAGRRRERARKGRRRREPNGGAVVVAVVVVVVALACSFLLLVLHSPPTTPLPLFVRHAGARAMSRRFAVHLGQRRARVGVVVVVVWWLWLWWWWLWRATALASLLVSCFFLWWCSAISLGLLWRVGVEGWGGGGSGEKVHEGD
jgi:hypothetical protein